MQIDVLLVIWLLFAHWMADFVFQDEEWALAKKHSIKALLKHTVVYSLLMTLYFASIIPFSNLLLFLVITFIGHTLVDFISSKLVGKKFERKELGSAIPNFGAFSFIGFDQFIHYIILLLTAYYLI